MINAFRFRKVNFFMCAWYNMKGDYMHIVFGGSFNPPTKGHFQIMKQLVSHFEHAKLIVVPVGNDYQKNDLQPFLHRYNMLKLMLDNIDNIIVSDIEAHRAYQGTLKTLDDLSNTYDDLYFVIGADNLIDLPNWINYKTLLASYPFIVMHREGHMTEAEAETMFKDLKHNFLFIDFHSPSKSSHVRDNIHAFREYLCDEVYEYIKKHHLYGV